MEAVLWLLLPVITATGSGLLAFLVMQARLEVAIAREREALAEAQAAIRSQDKVMEEKLRALEEETRRRALDEFLADIRVEERHYVKESRSLFINQKSMVLQERLYFRNIPLSDWVSHEFAIEEGGDIRALAKACSVFARASLGVGKEDGKGAKLLES